MSPSYPRGQGFHIASVHWGLHPDDIDRVRSELRAHFKSRESLSWLEFRFRHKDGSYRWIRSRAFVLRDPTGRG
jgi:PAS domain S-box-containing protein